MKNPYFNLIRTVWQNGLPWRKVIVGYYLAYVVAQLSLSLSPYAFGKTIDILQHFKANQLKDVIFWLAASVVLLLIFWLFHGPARVQERYVGLKIQQSFRIRVYEQLNQLPLKWHQNHHSGRIMTRVNRASIALHRFSENQFIYIETIMKFVVSIGFLFWISFPVGLLSLGSCVLAVFTVMLFDRTLIPLYDIQNELDNHVGAVFFDYLSNITTILTLRLSELTRHNLFQRMMKFWPFFRREVVLNEIKWFSMGIVLSATQSFILIGYIVYHLQTLGVVMMGTVVMIFRYQHDLLEVFYNFSAHYSDLVRMDTDVCGMQPILDDIQRFAREPQGLVVARQWHTIEIENLVFHHPGREDKKIFDSFCLKFKRGEKIALIGLSGGGKSTLLNLLRGLYKPDQAHLKIDGVAFDSLEPLQTITTLIPQDPEIFENTIAFNITLEVPSGPEEVERAIALARFSSVLEQLPLGLETDMREKGLNLSVGQKQRLALARGLFAARFSSLILMDEPTSSVDLPTEKEILSGVMAAFPEATLVVSLHRLHLLPQFDRIMMLDAGQVVADGPTSDLLAQPGPVRDLWLNYQEV